jgi:hypothetical protein
MADSFDLQTAFVTAAKVLGKEGYGIETEFYPYAGLKSTIRLENGKIRSRVSDGYQAAELAALTGLAIDLMKKLFRITNLDERAYLYLEEYQKLNGKGAYDLHETLRGKRGRKRDNSSQGKLYDLKFLLEKVVLDYPDVFSNTKMPTIVWSRKNSRRRLAFYDTAFDQIVVSKKFDAILTPQFFLEYLIFHEMLHAKHDVKYAKRRSVHHREFRLDEKRFREYNEARRLMGKI